MYKTHAQRGAQYEPSIIRVSSPNSPTERPLATPDEFAAQVRMIKRPQTVADEYQHGPETATTSDAALDSDTQTKIEEPGRQPGERAIEVPARQYHDGERNPAPAAVCEASSDGAESPAEVEDDLLERGFCIC